MASKKKPDSIYKYICKDTLNSRTFNSFKKVRESVVSLPKIPEKFIASKNDDENIIDINNEGGD